MSLPHRIPASARITRTGRDHTTPRTAWQRERIEPAIEQDQEGVWERWIVPIGILAALAAWLVACCWMIGGGR